MLTNDVDGIPDMGRVWTMDLSELAMESKPFARGAFGHVYKGEYFGTPVCVKILKNEDPNERASSFKLIQREVTSLKFGHPNLVQFMGAAEKGDEIYIITEYIHGGNLRQYIKDERVNIPWALRTQIGKDIACGMAYLHSKGIIHRDLKSKNLLVGDNWRIKICDFGFARSVSRRQLMTVCGTGEWMAPEVLQGVDYDEKADVYSFGIVLCELITRRKATEDLPRSHTDFSLDVSKFMPLVPDDCPPGLYNLALCCVAYDPHSRPSFKDITRTLKTLLSSLTPTTTAYPRPSSYSLLCSSTGAPPNPSPSTMSPMQQQIHQQQIIQKERQQIKDQQIHITGNNNNNNTKDNTVRTGRPHAATSPAPYTPHQTTHAYNNYHNNNHHNNNNHNNNHNNHNNNQYQNGFGNHWTNEGEGFVNVTGGSPSPSRAVVWSDNWENDKTSNNSSMGPLFVSNRLNPARKLSNASNMITPSSKQKKDTKDLKSPPPSPPPLLFSSSTPPTLITFSSSSAPSSSPSISSVPPAPSVPSAPSIPLSSSISTSSSTSRPTSTANTSPSFSPHSNISQNNISPNISPVAYATAQFHLLNTSSHSTRNTNAPHLATSPPKMHEKFTSISSNPNALAMSR